VLRYQCFVAGRPADLGQGADGDAFDADCLHVLVEEAGSGHLACTYRLLPMASGTEIYRSYSAQYYDLTRLSAFEAPMMELGRFCVSPERAPDADLLRVAWGAMTRLVDAKGIAMLFGCSSFAGADTARHRDALQMLAHRHLAPNQWGPARKAAETVDYAANLTEFDPKLALAATPALLRTYLMMGGWVSGHAVIDRALDTLHVFTGLPIASIPPARARALRALAI
ncbi:MAG: GNAT family N-acetyltransferase, partial [Paracoccaceae bacterium]